MAGPISAGDDLPRVPRSEATLIQLDPETPPVLEVEQGQRFVIETEDASTGLLRDGKLPPTVESTPYARVSPPKANPVAGPIAVAGVPARSRLEVEIHSIEVDASGVFYSRPAGSPLGDSRDWEALAEPYTIRIEHQGGEAIAPSGRRWPVAPMIGTLACAPDWEPVATTTGQGPWGGNLDVKAVRPGARVVLNACHEGGLLFAGDVHGCQGDGEYFGVADETRAELVLSARSLDGPTLPAPRIITEDQVIALGLGRPLEVAADRATRHLMRWLVDELEFSEHDAALAVGVHPGFELQVHSMTAIPALDFVVGAALPAAFVGLDG